jgi:asparagine synthase (glutamine-hydrolysing)
MCGIHGVTRYPRVLAQDDEYSEKVSQLLWHRGPDSQKQERVDDSCILGNTRLAIIDVASSHQPLTCRCGHHHLTFNGEIFNYKELRIELNYEFRTNGDTETLLALLCTRGIDSIHLLRGQFAFALWDSRLKQLSLAVDRFGILPLYFSDTGDRLCFSSSASSMSTNGKSQDLETLTRLLSQRAIVAPETPYPGVRRIPPGEVWTFSKDSLERRKWSKQIKRVAGRKPDSNELVRLINQAADRIVVSDVEIGVFLSGGLDSALVAKLVQERVSYPLKTYTAIWEEQNLFNEDESATRTAKQLGLQHNKVKVTATDWWQAMELGSRFRDGPMSEPADAVFFLLSERASQDVKVVTTGEGADELFCGYPKFRAELISSIWAVRPILKSVHPLLSHLLSEKNERLLYSASQIAQNSRFSSYFSTRWPDLSLSPFSDAKNFDDHFGLDALRDWDISHYLPSVLLDRADKMAMSYSVEVRPLYLDSDVADFALSFKAREHLTFFSTKTLLREAAKKILPADFVIEKKKGFPTPLSLWLKSDLFEPVRNLLLESQVPENLKISTNKIMELLEEHRGGKRDHSSRLFVLISLAFWLGK